MPRVTHASYESEPRDHIVLAGYFLKGFAFDPDAAEGVSGREN
jgi:hypothetical protein